MGGRIVEERRPTILLVEDSVEDVFFFRRALTRLNVVADVRVVVNGADAQSYLQGQLAYADRRYYPLPDLIVCDFKLPQKSGAEFLRWLRTQTAFEEIPFVLYSGSALKKEEELAMQLGATLYLRKTANFADTIERVQKIVTLLPKT
jgi:CheY-like chemotaxis protein